MNTQISIEQYLNELSSNSPTPGGGNVAALCGVLSSSLGMMVCNLTIGKKKYLEHENEMNEILRILSNAKISFEQFAQKDNEVFDKVMAAFKLPKETDEQKSLRLTEIDKATFDAAVVPNEVILASHILLPSLIRASEIGNQNSLSDIGVAISLISTAAEGAFMNVVINCSSLQNQTLANEFLIKSEIIYHEVKDRANSAIDSLIKRMRHS